MSGIAPKLPLRFSTDGGFAQTQTLKETIQQNFKNLLLTSQGERVMDINFGVGLRALLFENDSVATRNNVVAKIKQQAGIYMPFLNIAAVKFFTNLENSLLEANEINIQVFYFIIPLESNDFISINL